MNDIRYALRQLLKDPGFTIVAILTLALGIGANTAIFSIINAILLQPLPYAESQRIVQINEFPNNGFSVPSCGGVFLDWEAQSTQLEAIAAFSETHKNLTGEGAPSRVQGYAVSAAYLSVLRIQPALGRGFVAADDAPGGDRNVVILSHEFWQSHFHKDPAIVGQVIHLDGVILTVIGVLPPNALFATDARFLVPSTIRADSWKQSRDYNYVCQVIGRLKPGATAKQVALELNTAKQAINASYPSFKQAWGVSVRPLQEAIFGPARPFTFTLFAAVGLVLLIACANVANLLLSKASARQAEIAIRLALGASRGRIIRQLLTESLVLALVGGTAGIWLSAVVMPPLTTYTGLDRIPGLTVPIDQRVLLFTFLTTCATGLLFGLLPALSATRLDLHTNLKEGSRGSTKGTSRRLQAFLVISETALTVVLLVTTGLLMLSFIKAMNADTGFDHENVLTFTVTQPGAKAPDEEHRVRFTHDVLEHLAQIPGVTKVGEVSSAPMNGTPISYGDYVSREDRPETRNDLNAGFDGVHGDFFQAIGIPLLRGRIFSEAEQSLTAPRTIIINDVLARRFYGNENPIGQSLHFKDAVWEIIGVVGSIRRYQLDMEPDSQVYIPQIHFPWATTYVVRSEHPTLALAKDLQRAVQSIDPEQPIAGLQTLKQSVANSLRNRRVMLSLIGIFACTALSLACVGIYGVMAYSVTQRTREIGIRLALGADPKTIVSLIIRDGLVRVAIGLLIGTLCSLAAGALIYRQLFHPSVFDPIIVLIFVSLVLLGVSLLACWIPARRVTRIDPVEALGSE